MRLLNHLANVITITAVAITATACSYTNHFLSEDEKQEAAKGAYHHVEDLNVSEYDSWTYINLMTGKTVTLRDNTTWIYPKSGRKKEATAAPEIPMPWHIAIHRYEFKTNNATALNTHTDSFKDINTPPEGRYQADEAITYEEERLKSDNKKPYLLLNMDLTHMMDGDVGYAQKAVINRTLCESIKRTETGSMPPYLYSTAKDVLVLKWENGDWAKIQITRAYKSTGASGFLTLNYQYYPKTK